MNTRSTTRIKVLFSNTHDELLSDKANAEYQIASLLHLLITELKYTPEFPLELPDDSADKFLNPEVLKGYHILVLGAPTKDLQENEREAIRQFLAQGGGLLLLCNSEMLMDALPYIEGLTAKMGIELHEYHNRQPETIDLLCPHAMTANVTHLKVSNIASVTPKAGACPVAYVEIAKEPEIIHEAMAACIDLKDRQISEDGRIAVIGDVALCSDRFLECEDNKQFILNTFQWLARRNPLDIKTLTITETVNLGETGQVGVTLQHGNAEDEPYVECILESDNDAIIDAPLRGRTIQPERSVFMSWPVRPQNLGDQCLRLVIRLEQQQKFTFNLLPEMRCIAPGYLTLEIQDHQGKQNSTFETGDSVIVKGLFHSSTEYKQPLHLKLELHEGLAYDEEPLTESDVWHLKAIEPGTHRITITIPETGQTSSALVTVKFSEEDTRTELYTAYVKPLDAEIAERLSQVDPRLCHEDVKNALFEIALIDKYIERLYDEPSITWLREILTAARREKKRNERLIKHIMTYFFPTYQPRYRESVIPYAPGLVSHLTRLYPAERTRLEYNFLCSEETDDIKIKQNIAAYLLHEKYGHGFFYTQTKLGEQLSILERHGFPERPDSHEEYQQAARLIQDSSIVVNEGFGAWLELTFLRKLFDRDIRQAADIRHKYLLLDATGFLQRSLYRDFFAHFPPRYDSKYREGFERLEFIGRAYNLTCAIQALKLATQINFGIEEDESTKEIVFNKYTPEQIEAFFQKDEESQEEESLKWLSHLRLRQIADLLYNFKEKLERPVRRQYCLPAAINEDESQLKTIITKDLEGRIL